jgi:hypothetical protein
VGFDKRIVLVRASAGEPPIPAVTDHEHVAGAARHLARNTWRAPAASSWCTWASLLWPSVENSCVVGISWAWFCTGFLHQENPKRSRAWFWCENLDYCTRGKVNDPEPSRPLSKQVPPCRSRNLGAGFGPGSPAFHAARVVLEGRSAAIIAPHIGCEQPVRKDAHIPTTLDQQTSARSYLPAAVRKRARPAEAVLCMPRSRPSSEAVDN